MVLQVSFVSVIYNILYTVLVKRFCVRRNKLCSAVGLRCSRDGGCWRVFAAVREKVDSWPGSAIAVGFMPRPGSRVSGRG
jgi:hypothetical protein